MFSDRSIILQTFSCEHIPSGPFCEGCTYSLTEWDQTQACFVNMESHHQRCRQHISVYTRFCYLCSYFLFSSETCALGLPCPTLINVKHFGRMGEGYIQFDKCHKAKSSLRQSYLVMTKLDSFSNIKRSKNREREKKNKNPCVFIISTDPRKMNLR